MIKIYINYVTSTVAKNTTLGLIRKAAYKYLYKLLFGYSKLPEIILDLIGEKKKQSYKVLKLLINFLN